MGMRAALPGDQGPFLAAKPGSSKQGFGIEVGTWSLWVALRPGDKRYFTFWHCVGQHQADVEGRGRGAAATHRP